ncbi:MAG TPA: bifunctional nuclease domain-containing protein [Nitrososphaeraceae archaeon]|jgi:bifunctional DNase/RNase|nr:bifunctional nuclease domain-containing protein [Nitrososphaeraceae archaeon]
MNDFPTLDDDFIDVEITNIGYADSMGLEGFLVLRSLDGEEFPINAFSGEVAKHILRFRQGDKNTIPTIYNLVEEIAVLQDLLLMEIRIYLSGSVLRANLYFRGRKDNLILRNYRASDAIALASYYEVPIKVRKNLFREKIQQ